MNSYLVQIRTNCLKSRYRKSIWWAGLSKITQHALTIELMSDSWQIKIRCVIDRINKVRINPTSAMDSQFKCRACTTHREHVRPHRSYYIRLENPTLYQHTRFVQAVRQNWTHLNPITAVLRDSSLSSTCVPQQFYSSPVSPQVQLYP